MKASRGKEMKRSSLPATAEIADKCIECGECQAECSFLQKYGFPKKIAAAYRPADERHQSIPFECSLCGLCAAVCPVNIDPSKMFLEMRREKVWRGGYDFPEHSRLLEYESRGTSKRYTYYALPEKCNTIFFPGCTLSGTRFDMVMKLYEHMRNIDVSLGIVLDCCTKPSHDLGRQHHFEAMFGEMNTFLVENGVSNIIVACPSCYAIFAGYGKGLSVQTVYEVLAEKGLPITPSVSGILTIHDPCTVRHQVPIHTAVRQIIAEKGIKLVEMQHHQGKTLCCGEGGAVGFLSPELAGKWSVLRKKEADGKMILTYCAGCANFLGRYTPVAHLLDLVFEPERTISGKSKISKAPFTYLNRLRLKKTVRDRISVQIWRERKV
jgi:Fe-S oxidoreductase